MLPSLQGALRGLLAGVAILMFALLFVFSRSQVVQPSVLVSIAVVGAIAFASATGLSGLLRLLQSGTTDDTTNTSDWRLARIGDAVEESWNRWADAVVIAGAAAVGVVAFGALVTLESPSPGLLIVGFISSSLALFLLALLAVE